MTYTMSRAMCCTGSRACASSRCANAATIVCHVALGAVFTAHGCQKMKEVGKPIGFVKGTRWPGWALFPLLFTLLEFFGGIALIIGFLGQIESVLVVLEMTATTIFS